MAEAEVSKTEDAVNWLLWSIPVAFFTMIALGADQARRHGPTTCYVAGLYDVHCYASERR